MRKDKLQTHYKINQQKLHLDRSGWGNALVIARIGDSSSMTIEGLCNVFAMTLNDPRSSNGLAKDDYRYLDSPFQVEERSTLLRSLAEAYIQLTKEMN